MATSLASLSWWASQAGVTFLLAFSLLVILLNLSRNGSQTKTPLHDRNALRINQQGIFRIVVFSDLHFGEEEHGWGIDQDINTTRVMRSVLRQEQPDLVVLNGDLVTGENTFRENSSDYVHQIVAPMVDAGVPWASTYGNHDSQFNLSREALLQEETKYSLSLTRVDDGSLPGVTNFWLSIEDENATPVAVLWFLDSRGGFMFQSKPGERDYFDDWVAPETVAWFNRKNSLLETSNGQPLPSLVFTHIPPHVYKQAQLSGVNPKHFPGLHEDNPLGFQGDGSDDGAFVQALSDTPKIHSVHTGHDHGDSWCSSWPVSTDAGSRPFLCFAKHTGYGGYGTWNRGARVIELGFADKQLHVSTWVRMESAAVVTKVSLNETYGVDVYPEETGEES